MIYAGNQLADKLDGMLTEVQILEDKYMLTVGKKMSQDSSESTINSTSDASMRRRMLEAELVSLVFT